MPRSQSQASIPSPPFPINNFVLEWSEVAVSDPFASMTTAVDEYGNVYLCGGKVSIREKSKKCVRINVDRSVDAEGFATYSITKSNSGGTRLKVSGPWPGLYLEAARFTSESQNEGGIYGNRLCMLSISDGTNKPKCWCCDITAFNAGDDPSSVKCDDLQYSIVGGCPERFDACVVHDETRHRIIQIGGYYGDTIHSSILV